MILEREWEFVCDDTHTWGRIIDKHDDYTVHCCIDNHGKFIIEQLHHVPDDILKMAKEILMSNVSLGKICSYSLTVKQQPYKLPMPLDWGKI